jgi:hypothetical protein
MLTRSSPPAALRSSAPRSRAPVLLPEFTSGLARSHRTRACSAWIRCAWPSRCRARSRLARLSAPRPRAARRSGRPCSGAAPLLPGPASARARAVPTCIRLQRPSHSRARHQPRRSLPLCRGPRSQAGSTPALAPAASRARAAHAAQRPRQRAEPPPWAGAPRQPPSATPRAVPREEARREEMRIGAAAGGREKDRDGWEKRNRGEGGIDFPKDLCAISENCRNLSVKQNFHQSKTRMKKCPKRKLESFSNSTTLL